MYIAGWGNITRVRLRRVVKSSALTNMLRRRVDDTRNGKRKGVKVGYLRANVGQSKNSLSAQNISLL